MSAAMQTLARRERLSRTAAWSLALAVLAVAYLW
jgi:hypothetical protein